MQPNDGFSGGVRDNANMGKQWYVNLEGWFEVLSQWIWIWYKKMKCRKLN